jgi:UDP-N-acetyl-D-mannosaminuronate dehydrogenase
MRIGVIGLGETGKPLYNILKEKYETVGIDINTDFSGKLDILNICIPYSKDFIKEVKQYSEEFQSDLIIVHSTVPIGTTSQISNAVHSPILGDHTNMVQSIRQFTKWIGGERAEEAEVLFAFVGIPCRTVKTSEETELLKLMCLAKYGMSIAFAQYQKDCFDRYGFDYSHILEWDMNYNLGVKGWQQRPLIKPPEGSIKGHCLIPGTKMLDDFMSNNILREVLRYS